MKIQFETLEAYRKLKKALIDLNYDIDVIGGGLLGVFRPYNMHDDPLVDDVLTHLSNAKIALFHLNTELRKEACDE